MKNIIDKIFDALVESLEELRDKALDDYCKADDARYALVDARAKALAAKTKK